VAAAAVIVFLVGVSFLYAPTVRTLDAPVGEGASFRFELADGSSVVLAAGSSLSLTNAFGDAHRRVRLVGEGYFDVSSGTVPFIIDTYNARTRVLGTRFSVRAWSREIDSATEVIVEEGIVSVSSTLDGDEPVQVSAGEATSVPSGSMDVGAIQEIDLTRAFTWTQGGYEYSNEPLGNVLDDLERRFDLNLEAPEALRLRPITIYNQTGPGVEDVLGDISAAIGVRYRRIADGFELFQQQRPDSD
jgi:ferric-dicitrate binding protein FerR (iron transport regulator)